MWIFFILFFQIQFMFQNNMHRKSQLFTQRQLQGIAHILIYRLARLLVMYEINMFIGMCQLYS